MRLKNLEDSYSLDWHCYFIIFQAFKVNFKALKYKILHLLGVASLDPWLKVLNICVSPYYVRFKISSEWLPWVIDHPSACH